MTSKLSRSPLVREQSGEDGIVLLDVMADRMYSLDRRGSEMWRQMTAHGQVQLLARFLHESWHLSNEEARSEAARFTDSLTARGLLVQGDCASVRPGSLRRINPSATNRGEHPVALMLRSFIWLVRIEWEQFCRGFHGLYQLVASRPVVGSAVAGTLERSRHAFDRVCVFYPRPVLCLVRSAAMAVLLRDRGVAAEFVVGVRRHPFQAHAWLEVNGVVINDKQGVKNHYQQLDRM